MVSQAIKAIYENGIFRPMDEPELPIGEGDQVSLIVESRLSPQEITRLAARVFEGLSEEEIREIEKIALDRGSFSNSSPI
ncbi:MAG TPA: antitoxin family protein [Chloroflexia bacterium]|nr:antitoxin family protein [Chloroflexia bacterium]